jgi:hypothetical protein
MRLITGGCVVGSTRKARNASGGPRLYCLIIGKRTGLSLRKDDQRATAFTRLVDKPGHSPVAKCCRVPGWFVQPGILQFPEESPDQCLLSQHVLYLPLSILACTVAFLTS